MLNKQGAMRKKGEASFNGNDDAHSKLLASSDGICTNDVGGPPSSITPIVADRRRTAQFKSRKLKLLAEAQSKDDNNGIIDINKEMT